MGPWRIEMLGGLRAVSGDGVITRFRTQPTGGRAGAPRKVQPVVETRYADGALCTSFRGTVLL
jgi:hypothetical protein